MSSPITLRQQMVAGMRGKNGAIRNPEVEQAFLAVPRHLFVPDVDHETAYRDAVVPLKRDEDGYPISSSSQPTMMALMLEQLALKPGMRVLEIGAGSGYNAALMAHIVGKMGKIVTIDIDDDLVEGARAHLSEAGYLDRVQVICADGIQGYAPDAPYDRIILTAAGWDISPQWHQQLTPDGMIVMPFVIGQQQFSVALQKQGEHYTSSSMLLCRFMPMRGEQPGHSQTRTIVIRPQVELRINMSESMQIPDEDVIRDWLQAPLKDIKTGLKLTRADLNTLYLMELQARNANHTFCDFFSYGDEITAKEVPYLSGTMKSYRYSHGIIAPDGLALLMRPARMTLPDEYPDDAQFRLWVRVYGAGGEKLAHSYIDLLRAWFTQKKMTQDDLWMEVHPRTATLRPQPHTIIVPKRWTQVLIGWQ